MSQSATTTTQPPSGQMAVGPMLGILALLTAVGLGLRVIGLNSQLWYDEIFSLVVSGRLSMWEILTTYTGDITHPLYSVLLHASIATLGESAWTVRLPAIAFGIASIPLLFALGRAIATTSEALLAAALLVVSYHHIWFSQNARGYTALLFWALLCTLLFYRGLKDGRWPAFAGYTAAAALGVYTHMTFVFVVVGHAAFVALFVAVSWRRAEERRRLALAALAIFLSGVLTLLFYAPILGQVIGYFRHTSGKMKAVSTPGWALVETVRGLQLGFGSVLVVAMGVLLVACGLRGYWKENRTAFWLLVFPSAATCFGVLGAGGSIYPRYLFLLAGFAILIVVRGAMVVGDHVERLVRMRGNAVPRRMIGIAGMLLLIAASALSLGRVYRLPKQDIFGALAFVESQRQEGEPVMTAGAAAWPIHHYYNRDWPQLKDIGALDTIGGHGRRVWLVYTFPRYIDDETPGLVAVIRRRFREVRVFPGTLNDGEVFVCVQDTGRPPALAATPTRNTP